MHLIYIAHLMESRFDNWHDIQTEIHQQNIYYVITGAQYSGQQTSNAVPKISKMQYIFLLMCFKLLNRFEIKN